MTTMRWLIGVSAALLCATSRASAQSVDPRFQPWIGCWRAVGEMGAGQPSRACLTPAQSGSGSVDILLYAGDSVLSRTSLPSPGRSRERQIDECRGTETAEWTADESRLILRAVLECARGIRRVETGLMSITPSGEWLQMQHMEVGGNSATTATRFALEEDREVPAGITLGSARSSRTLRMAVGGPVALGQIAELSRRVPIGLLEAWVTELGQRFTLDGKALVTLADQGLPPRIIDVLVAMSHPEAFSVRTDAESGRAGTVDPWGGDPMDARSRRIDRCGFYDDFCYGPGGLGAWGLGWRFGYGPWDPWDPWGYRYGPAFGRNSGYYTYSPYGYGGGMYWGRQPIVIVNRPTGRDEPDAERGRAVNGGGYTRTSTPRTGNGGSPSSRSGGSSSTSSGTGSSGSSGSGSTGSSTGRTAKPRPPGGR